MRHLITVIILLISLPSFAQVNGGSNIHYDVEFDRICLVDSIAPDTIIQFWRYTHANNPGSLVRDVTFDLSGAYNVQGTLVKCCECLTDYDATAYLTTGSQPYVHADHKNQYYQQANIHFMSGCLLMTILFLIWKKSKKEYEEFVGI
jgi:hypothetical protein